MIDLSVKCTICGKEESNKQEKKYNENKTTNRRVIK